MIKNLLLSIFLFFLVSFKAYAVSLFDALKQTYQNNLELKAERKNLEVQKEVLNISKSDFFHQLYFIDLI